METDQRIEYQLSAQIAN